MLAGFGRSNGAVSGAMRAALIPFMLLAALGFFLSLAAHVASIAGVGEKKRTAQCVLADTDLDERFDAPGRREAQFAAPRKFVVFGGPANCRTSLSDGGREREAVRADAGKWRRVRG